MVSGQPSGAIVSSSGAREQILTAVREARPEPVGAPDVVAVVAGFDVPAGDLAARFIEAAEGSGARVVRGARRDLSRLVATELSGATRILSAVAGVASSIVPPGDGKLLADLDAFVCEATLGIAENGAAWLSVPDAVQRAALFLASHLIVVLERRVIVAHMHAAYARIDLGAQSFGLLVAGPSKTADIEQSLVIGAQGPMQLTLLLVDDGSDDVPG